MSAPSLRSRLYAQLAPEARKSGLSPLNRLVGALIICAAVITILATEPTLNVGLGAMFAAGELLLAGLFLVEYLARVWVAPEAPGEDGPWAKRRRFILSPWAIIDLFAVVASFAPGFGPTLLLRGFRLMRVLRLARLGRLSNAWQLIGESVSSRRPELILSLLAGLVLMLVSATLLYLVEGEVQPDKFGSIPRALWWAVATMTTIGYGDVYPVTPVGEMLAGVAAVTSIGLIALPTGILASAFSEALARHRADQGEQ